jgi:hypothetical protein
VTTRVSGSEPAIFVSEEGSHVAVWPLVLECPEGKVAFVGFVGINVHSYPSTESDGHSTRRRPRNSGDARPFAREVDVA